MGLYGNLTFRFVLFCFADLRFRDKHSNESWNCFDKSSIPGALSSGPFLKTFAAVYPHPTDRPWVYDRKNA